MYLDFKNLNEIEKGNKNLITEGRYTIYEKIDLALYNGYINLDQMQELRNKLDKMDL